MKDDQVRTVAYADRLLTACDAIVQIVEGQLTFITALHAYAVTIDDPVARAALLAVLVAAETTVLHDAAVALDAVHGGVVATPLDVRPPPAPVLARRRGGLVLLPHRKDV